MARARRRASAALSALAGRLREAAAGFELGQALRVVRWLAEAGGREAPPQPVANPFPVFPAAELQQLSPPEPTEPDAAPRPPRLLVNILGLIGPMGVLPAAYNETVVRALRARGGSLAAFLDILHARAITLFAAAGHKYRLPVAYEAADKPLADPLTGTLGALAGLDTPGKERVSPDEDRLVAGVPDTALIFYAGHLARWPRSASALEAMLGHLFGLPVRVEPFRPRWLVITPDERSRLPLAGARTMPFCRLGTDAVLGLRFRDASSTIRLIIGPLPFGTFRELLPDRQRLAAIGRLAGLYLGPGILVEAQLVLRRAEAPPLVLAAAADPGPRLGWTCWLGTPPGGRDLDDAVFVGSGP